MDNYDDDEHVLVLEKCLKLLKLLQNNKDPQVKITLNELSKLIENNTDTIINILEELKKYNDEDSKENKEKD